MLLRVISVVDWDDEALCVWYFTVPPVHPLTLGMVAVASIGKFMDGAMLVEGLLVPG